MRSRAMVHIGDVRHESIRPSRGARSVRRQCPCPSS